MYFTDTPTLNSIEAIMKNCPMAVNEAVDAFVAHTNIPRKTAIAGSAFTTEKRQAARLHFAPCWISGLGVAGLLPVRPSNPPLPGRGTSRSKDGSQNYMTERMLNT